MLTTPDPSDAKASAGTAPDGSMTDATLTLAPDGAAYAFEPQDRGSKWTWSRVLTMALSLLVLAAAVWQARSLNVADITALVPTSPLFWFVFVLSYLAGPFSEWVIFRKLWGVSIRAMDALIRKLIYNELLLGYLGEVYFYTWARRKLPMEATPFGAVKDVAIMSAVAGNIMTLLLIALAYPYLALLPLAEYGNDIAWSLAFVVGISLVPFLLRRQIFSLTRRELWMVFGIHVARIVATTGLNAVLWALVLPQVQIGWWLVLSAIRLLVSRLPFVPNKDVVFAGIAVLALGQDVEIAALMAMMAALILSTHLILALIFGLYDLAKGDKT
jgi:hypothetical protein